MQTLKNEKMTKSSFSASSSSSSSLSSSNFSLPQADHIIAHNVMASVNTSSNTTNNNQNSFLTDKFVKKTNRVKDTPNTLTAIDNYIEEKTHLG
jgi:hypothetical protein